MMTDNQPKTPENIATVLMWTGLGAYLAGSLVNSWIVAQRLYDYFGPGMVVLNSFALLFVASAIIRALLAKGRMAIIREDKANRNLAAASPPYVDDLQLKDSLVLLFWTIDYKRHTKINTTYLLYSPVVWLAVLGLAAYWGLRYTVAPALAAGLTNGVLVFDVLLIPGLLYVRTTTLLRKQYLLAQLQYYGLVVDPGGLRLITGRIVNWLPWDSIKRVWNVRDNIYIFGHTWVLVVPSYAFQKPGDAKSLLDTMRALKRGAKPPVHDWSGYNHQPVEPVTQGVWPPPIGS